MRPPLCTLPLLALLACGDKEPGDSTADDSATDSNPGTADTYQFTSAFGEGSSVAYDGQVFRQLLISDLKSRIGGMTARIDSGAWYPAAGEVTAELNFYFEFSSDAYGSLQHGYSSTPDPLQATYDEVSSGKDLVGKIAGNDPTGQHRDWSTELVGWTAEGVTTPESLVRAWFAVLDAQALARVNGEVPLDPLGQPITAIYLDAQGRDYNQLIEKFLRGAVSFSQGVDDYLDDDLEGKGLNSDHTGPEEGKLWTTLEHQWDEGFGYFGAAADYGAWSDAEISDTPALDRDGDGAIDLLSEVCWGHSTNAARRDAGAVSPTDFTAQAWEGFLRGRELLASTAGEGLSAAERAELLGWRDQAVSAWEAAIAASVVHYINAVLADMATIGTEDYTFADHAKHWSEMKGFALSFQFNPRSPLGAADFATLHTLLGQAPALPGAGADALAAYADGLREARALLGDTYGFDAANLGDDDGQGGW